MPNPFEEIGAKGAGAVKAIGGALKGLHGVFNTLVEQHGEVSMLLERAKMSKDPEKRLDLWQKIRAELLSHERAELDVVYPAFRDHAQLQEFAEEHSDEASDLEQVIFDIDGVDIASPSWVSKLEALIALVKHHVDEEENHYFPEAMEVLGKDYAAELDQRFKAKKEAVVEQLA